MASKGTPSLDVFSKGGQVIDRSGLTKAGRALDKYGGHLNSPFPKAMGNPASKNMQGQYHLDDILTDPKSNFFIDKKGIRIFSQDGRGVYFKDDRTMIGFIEKQYE